MTDEISKKIDLVLNNWNTSEDQVLQEAKTLYILSQARKLLERKKQMSKYKNLSLICHWVLHSKLDRYQKILNEITRLMEQKPLGFEQEKFGGLMLR